jgi:mono/diheme cytochrome c family protein
MTSDYDAEFFFATVRSTSYLFPPQNDSRNVRCVRAVASHPMPLFPAPSLFAIAGLLALSASTAVFAADSSSSAVRAEPTTAALLEKHCFECHDSSMKKGDLSLEGIAGNDPATNPALWERVFKKLNHRQMPPVGEERPDEATYRQLVSHLGTSLDRAAAAQPNPGRTDTFRRLTRTEYQNAIRDLLALEIDATALLPNDEPSHGFDNVTVGNLSPTLLDRYVSAAQKIARLAVGTPRKTPGGETFRVAPDVTQEDHVDGLPIGTRGGAMFRYIFPQDGTYELKVRLARDRNEEVEGLKKAHEVEVLIDRERVALEIVKPPGADKNHERVDAHLTFKVEVKAGPHDVAVTFPKNPTTLLETERQPFVARYNMHRHPRTAPALYQLTITGPFDARGAGDTPSRRKLFGTDVVTHASSASDEVRAREVLTPLLRRAYRRPVTDEDLRKPMQFFREGAADGCGFEAGIENALSAILVSPRFLIRVEEDPAGVAPGTAYRVSDLELASRLSFFLWSSIPDDALLDAAVRGDLRQPKLLEQQVRRMLADARARSLVTNFASQWLHLRKLESITPDLRLFPNFDDNLRQAFREETELFIESVVREDRSIRDLLAADYTFLNERLAKHYGIPHIYGSRFRRVSFADDPNRQRGGLLRHGSILTVTSYATRTSPVIRGHWILANLAGEPPPPPPPNVPALDDNTVSASLPIRERLAEHRANPSCASCHDVMDPVGFALENFDATGRWRTAEDHKPIDASGGLPDGSTFTGVAALERGLLQRPELFAGTLSEKLLIFALGRGVETHDAPAIREIVRRAQADNFRFSSLILGIVNSTPFQMRKSP